MGDLPGVASALGHGAKEWISFALYLASVPAAFVSPYISIAFYVIVSVIWVIPDRRFERELFERKEL